MGTGYRVDPAGVNGVVKSVIASAKPIETAAGALQGHVSTAAGGASSAIVDAALTDAFATLGAELQEIRTKIPAVLHGTAEAGQAILQGDEEMAQQIVGLATGALSETDALRSMAHGAAVPR